MSKSAILLAGVALAVVLGRAPAQNPSAQGAAAPGTPAATAAAPGSADTQNPADIVQAAAQGMLNALDKDRATYKRDPAKIRQLVDQYLLPHWDTEYSARLVLGKFWRTATPDQRQRFIEAFYHSLLANYGSALAEFTSDRLKIFPTNLDASTDRAVVRTEVKTDSGERISVNYAMRKTANGWKAWDVNIDG